MMVPTPILWGEEIVRPNRFLLVLSVAVAAAAISVRASAGTYVETFKTLFLRDVVNTTAVWDTAAGQIELPGFPLAAVDAMSGLGDARDVALSERRVVVADPGGQIYVIDASDPTNLVFVDGYGASALGIDARHGRAVLARGAAGIEVVDVSGPTIVSLGTAATGSIAREVYFDGRYAWVAAQDSLIVFAVGDIGAPGRLGAVATPGLTLATVVDGDFAFVADGASGVAVVDVTDPQAMSVVAGFATPGFAQDVALNGNLLAVATGGDGVSVVDVSSPLAPTLWAAYDTPDLATGVYWAGRMLYTGDGNTGVVSLDASIQNQLNLVDTHAISGRAYRVGGWGNHLFVAGGAGGLFVRTIGEPISPLLGDLANGPPDPQAISVVGRYAYTAAGLDGMVIVDVADPNDAFTRGAHNTPGYAYGVHVRGDLAYVADGGGGLRVVDIANPDAPALVGSEGTPGTAFDVVVVADTALVADGNSGVRVVDVTNPGIPSGVASWATGGDERKVMVFGRVGAAVGQSGAATRVVTFDVGDLSGYAPLSSGGITGTYADAAVSGNRIVLLTTNGTVGVQEVAANGTVSLLGAYLGLTAGVALAAWDNVVAVLEDANTLVVLDTSDPTAIAEVGRQALAANGRSLAMDGQYAFVGDDGLRIAQVINNRRDRVNNRVQSLNINASFDDVVSVRIGADTTAGVVFDVSVDGGSQWSVVPADNQFYRLGQAGDELRWRTTHSLAQAGVGPAVSQLTLSWLGESAIIESTVDVPSDNGGFVRLSLSRSGYDVATEVTFPIVNYTIHRRISTAVFDLAEPIALAELPPNVPDLGERVELRRLDDRYLARGVVTSGGLEVGDSFPPGVWEIVGFVPSLQQDEYLTIAPTLQDSSSVFDYTVFVAVANTTTPGVFFVSAPDSGYSLDNSTDLIPPAAPTSFVVEYRAGQGNWLNWDANVEPDFLYYKVYRGTHPGFVPTDTFLVHQTFTTEWKDMGAPLTPQYYKLRAVDGNMNESIPAVFFLATPVVPASTPDAVLLPAYPNPFNPVTTIPIYVSRRSRVIMTIYDSKGRRIKTLLDAQLPAGRHEAMWDGRNRFGRPASSGVYLVKLAVGDVSSTQKLTLLK